MTHNDRMRLALEAAVALQTVTRWDKGLPVRQAMRAALESAAERLGLKEKREVQAEKAG
jgi:lactam utilization protein B